MNSSNKAQHYDVVVIGGQAGLAVGYYLRRTGLSYVVLDARQGPGGAWRHAWDSLTLFPPAQWSFLPVRIATAMPWLLAGATASAVLASSLGGDARSTNRSQRVIDAMFIGGALGVAVGSAQLLQNSLMEMIEHTPRSTDEIITVALAGFLCGAVIGFKVPSGYKTNLVTPPDPVMARALRDLLRQAESALGSKIAAENWVFTPHSDLGWITPAEAAQYKTHATGVKRLLESEAAARREEARAERPPPVVIEGGRSPSRLAGVPA